MPAPANRKAAIILFATLVSAEVTWVTALMSGPAYQRVLELTNTQLGMCLGAMPLGSLLMSAVIGHATARHGPRRILRIGIGGMILGLAAVAASRGFFMLLPALILAGLSAATLHNGGITLLSDTFPKNIRRIMALAAAMWFGSSVISAPLIGTWLSYAQGQEIQRWSFGLPCAVGIGLLTACFYLTGRVLAKRSPAPPVSLPNPDQVPDASAPPPGARWLWVVALGFGHGLLVVTFIAWANPMIQQTFGLGDFHGGLAFSAFALGVSGGRTLLAFRDTIRNDHVLLGVSGIAGGIVLGLSLVIPSYPLTLLAIATGAFVAAATIPCLFSLVAAHFPAIKSRIYGYLEASISLGGLTGPFLVGVLVDHNLPVHLSMMISPLAGVTLGLISFAWLVSERRRRVQGQEKAPTPPLPSEDVDRML